jgi:hypothetical protein
VTQAAAAEVHSHPERPRLVGEDVHVVVAAPHGPELGAGLLPQVAPVPRRDDIPRRVIEQRRVHRRVIGAVLPADPEADAVRDLVGHLPQRLALLAGVGAQGLEGQVGTDGGVAARDVEAHAHDRDLVAVGRHATDGHDVAHVAVGHERHLPRTLRHLAQLEQCGFVVHPEDLHAASCRLPASGGCGNRGAGGE